MDQEKEIYKFNPNHYCAIYARRSNSNEKYKIDNQLQKCRDKAEDLDLIIYNEYSDHESATKFEPLHREGFKQLIYDLKNDKFKTLITFKRDRLARSPLHFKQIQYLLREHGVKVYYAADDEHQFNDTPSEILMENLIVAFSSLEALTTRYRTQSGKDIQRKGKIYLSARTPFGYEKVGKGKTGQFKIVPNEAKFIKELFKLIDITPEDQLSARFLTDMLNKKYSKEYNKTFSQTEIRNYIKQPLYAGYFMREAKSNLETAFYHDETKVLYIDDSLIQKAVNVDSIISDFDFWKKCLLKIYSVMDHSQVSYNQASPSLFKGLLYCSKCKKSIFLINGRFVCGSKCIDIEKEKLYEHILVTILADILTYENITKYYNAKIDKEFISVRNLEGELASIEKKRDSIILSMIKDNKVYHSELNKINNEYDILNIKLKDIKAKITEYNNYKNTMYLNIKNKEKRALMNYLIFNENVGNDFFKDIIKKVYIDVSGKKATIKPYYQSSSIS